MKISKDSIIYKIARHGNRYVYEETNLCGFINSFLNGLFDIILKVIVAFLAGMSIIGLVAIMFWAPIHWLYTGISFSEFINTSTGMPCLVLWIGVAVVCFYNLIVFLFNYLKPEKQSVLVRAIKDKFEKVCSRVEFD